MKRTQEVISKDLRDMRVELNDVKREYGKASPEYAYVQEQIEELKREYDSVLITK